MKIKCLALFFALLLFSCPVHASDAWLWPVTDFYNVSSGFGMRSFGYHKGIDIAGPEPGIIADAPILASKSGTVLEIGTDCVHNYPKTSSCGCGGGYGNYVYLLHADGTVSRYGHLTHVLVTEGMAVLQGDIIGTVGSTGSSTGHHLHFEIRDPENEPVNPMPQNAEGRHTYEGSSAPFSESLPYLYAPSTDRKTEAAVCADGTVQIQLYGYAAPTTILLWQFANGHLICAEARPFAEKAETLTPHPSADTLSILLQTENEPVAEAKQIKL